MGGDGHQDEQAGRAAGQYPPQHGGGYPPEGAYPPPAGGGYPPQEAYPPPAGYPPQHGEGYPPQGAYPPPAGYPPQHGGDGKQDEQDKGLFSSMAGYAAGHYPSQHGGGYPPQGGYPPDALDTLHRAIPLLVILAKLHIIQEDMAWEQC
ncbi:hypothetical protein L1987_68781 [Smallanthus sonchifolius]|uniref:Uncharacterized protein n=1 Tax=Smallanthus sonchifolius TaxID=185202 RepID=A0ACB9B614_9ASTR|nr:hypothetical protein L1987_68781 [Smallanthus sonchifolius]